VFILPYEGEKGKREPKFRLKRIDCACPDERLRHGIFLLKRIEGIYPDDRLRLGVEFRLKSGQDMESGGEGVYNDRR